MRSSRGSMDAGRPRVPCPTGHDRRPGRVPPGTWPAIPPGPELAWQIVIMARICYPDDRRPTLKIHHADDWTGPALLVYPRQDGSHRWSRAVVDAARLRVDGNGDGIDDATDEDGAPVPGDVLRVARALATGRLRLSAGPGTAPPATDARSRSPWVECAGPSEEDERWRIVRRLRGRAILSLQGCPAVHRVEVTIMADYESPLGWHVSWWSDVPGSAAAHRGLEAFEARDGSALAILAFLRERQHPLGGGTERPERPEQDDAA